MTKETHDVTDEQLHQQPNFFVTCLLLKAWQVLQHKYLGCNNVTTWKMTLILILFKKQVAKVVFVFAQNSLLRKIEAVKRGYIYSEEFF